MKMASWIALPPQYPLYLRCMPPPSLVPHTRRRRRFSKPLNCSPLQQQPNQLQQQLYVKDDDEEAVILCELCNGIGWLLCDFCKGQKTNVKAENKRIYRRCPSCRAVGYVLCARCKVFKCVTFPNPEDGEELSF